MFEGDGSFGPLHNEASTPVPMSMALHKYEPEEPKCPLWLDRAHGKNEAECPTCSQALEESKGAPVGSVRRRHRTRVELDERGVAREGNLFTQNSVADGNRFSGWLHGAAVDALEIDGAPIEDLILGGRGKIQGAARIEVDREAVPPRPEVIEDGLVLRLLGPGAFVDDFGFPSAFPDTEELARVLGVAVELDQERSWTRWGEIGGWHIASGLPKPVERVVEPGSTFVVRCEENPDAEALRTLMARGIGLRRREGFGALYEMVERPMTKAAILQGTKALVSRAEWKNRHRGLFLDRVQRMRTGEPSTPDKELAESAVGTDKYGKAVRLLLGIVDPALLENVLEELPK